MKKFVKIMTVALLVAMAVTVFAGCLSSDYNVVKANLEEAGYSVSVTTSSTAILSYALPEGAEASLIATKDALSKDAKMISIIYFKDAASAKAYYDEMKADRDEAYAKLNDEEKKEYDEEMKNYAFGKSGKAVYYGNKEAYKAC